MKPVVPRRRAEQDIDEIVDYYVAESAQETTLRFIDALESAYGRISRHPRIGSLRCAYEVALPGLRCWPLKASPTWSSTSSATTTLMFGASCTSAEIFRAGCARKSNRTATSRTMPSAEHSGRHRFGSPGFDTRLLKPRSRRPAW